MAHIARHKVTPDEVEEVCHGEYIVRETYDERILLIGPAPNGRMLVVILGPTEKEAFIIRLQHALLARKSVTSIERI